MAADAVPEPEIGAVDAGAPQPPKPEPSAVSAPVNSARPTVPVVAALSPLEPPGEIRFETGHFAIKGAAAATLRAVAATMAAREELKLTLRGHTDNRGRAKYNRQLSHARARRVARYLSRRGVAWDRMTIVGVGHAEPIDPAATPEAWERNRRVELVWQPR